MLDSGKQFKSLRLILGDQLHCGHSWFADNNGDVLYLIAELKQETSYVKHHVQKLCAFFAAMRAFADALKARGHEVLHLTLDDTAGYADLPALIADLCLKFRVESFEFQTPDEYRLLTQLRALDLGEVAINECDSEHFLLGREEFGDYIAAGRHNRMETFYRKMRRRFDLLMWDGEPLGGQWNYDADNRAALKAGDLESIPAPLLFANDVSEVLGRLDRHRVDYFGQAAASLVWPVDRAQALELLDFFCRTCLPNFGRFQDAMTGRHRHAWSLYHSRLSFALNSKILGPMEVMQAAIETYQTSGGDISLAQVEGFVRQILGWREYIRAVYWVNMPEYSQSNSLQAELPLPEYFWDGETRMNCMSHALGQSLEFAYAHHIQRLMIIGNFCLLAGIDPDAVDRWYLGVYVDALEWVEMPNTRGMSQFADGGLVATKPYSAGANYINRMSDYCGDCSYDRRQKTGDKACPFNSLYWDFMARHRPRLEKNPRIGMIYRNWDKQAQTQREAVLERARWCRNHLDEL